MGAGWLGRPVWEVSISIPFQAAFVKDLIRSLIDQRKCHCGLVNYTSTSAPQNLTYCYCTICRHLSGSPFIAWADITSSSLDIPNGTTNMKTLASKVADRTICSACGSSITMKYASDDATIGIAAGTIDERSLKGEAMKLTEHIFVEQKPGWYNLPEDGLKRWERFSAGFEEKLQAWMKERS
ncbi:MAG: hypothetical protein Q9172_001594 [Xanthocarpia lactea]